MKNKTQRGLLSMAVLQLIPGVMLGATVGQWNGNTSVWANSGNFSTFYTSATAQGVGHTIGAASAISAQSLTASTHFVVESSATTLVSSQLGLLTQWVQGGGTLLLFAGTNNSTAAQILTALASGIATGSGAYGGGNQYSTLSSSSISILTSPNDVRGQTIEFAGAFQKLTGGSGVGANQYGIDQTFRMETINLGRIYVLGGHFEHNNYTQINETNLQFMLNLLASGQYVNGLVEVGGVPEPASMGLTAAALGCLLYLRRRAS